jgi:GrpB-like predicted nucleotidyltransferase (UPF0157 family)
VDQARREAHLDRVLIGGREKSAIVIADYDPRWPQRFEAEAVRIRRALGARALRIEHIGSTAVPGLAAKPIIDILVGVDDPDDASDLRPRLERSGYELRVREPGHLMFRTPARDVHVHVWRDSDPEVKRHLRFRDRLRSSPADRAAYEHLKRNLARREWSDMNEYADAKSGLIGAILARGRHTLDPRPPEQT